MNRIPSVSLQGGADAAAAAPPDPAALARWARAFCVIRFDLERGQLVEACYPPDALAHGGLDRLVAFSSFPDSMSTMSSHTAGSVLLRHLGPRVFGAATPSVVAPRPLLVLADGREGGAAVWVRLLSTSAAVLRWRSAVAPSPGAQSSDVGGEVGLRSIADVLEER